MSKPNIPNYAVIVFVLVALALIVYQLTANSVSKDPNTPQISEPNYQNMGGR